ncbi:MAG: hypothetical protein K1X72_00965 [Pyrinomonadaceae bacterium]|nr:hypothetical protein [Pyrinomonadaceae bacterium]
MKNKTNFLLVIAVMVFIIGCTCNKSWEFGKSEPPKSEKPSNTTEKPADSPTKPAENNSNKTLVDKATDVATEGDKIGIPECDELMDYFRSKIDDSDMDYVSKAFWKVMESQFRDGIKKNLEENKADKAQTAKFCREFKIKLEEEEQKKKN